MELVQVQFRIPKNLRKQFKMKLVSEGLIMRDVLEELIITYLEDKRG